MSGGYQIEDVSLFGFTAEAPQLVEHELVSQTRVRGYDSMRVLATDGETGTV